MKNQHLVGVSLLFSLMTVAGVSAAAQHGMPMDRQGPGHTPAGMPGPMAGPIQGMMAGPMTNQMPGLMMGSRHGMDGMMAGCPMMGEMSGVLTPQQQMKMRAEMMQSMGKIMEKYAAQAGKGSE